jgi:hypothetical protein
MEKYYKYNRTYHLPCSLGSTCDDKFLESTKAFEEKTIVITEKMDGENTSMYPDKIHARSLDSRDHISRHWVKGEWGRIRSEIPRGWRICGENMYAKHSIYYENLDSYFYVFSIWDDNNMCLSWSDTEIICDSLGIITVPVIGIGIYDEEYLKYLAKNIDFTKTEGFVIRNVESFHYDDFTDNVAKFVRENHVITDQHWMENKVVPNKLRK